MIYLHTCWFHDVNLFLKICIIYILAHSATASFCFQIKQDVVQSEFKFWENFETIIEKKTKYST